MPIQFDKFDQPKVDNLKSHLELMASKGKSKFYEIFVDALKAVPKTDEPEEFDNYEKYMAPDTAQLKIVIYNSAGSPRNDQYVFLFKAHNREEAMEIGLNGMPVKTFSYNDISEWREKNTKKTAEQMEIKRLKNEISDLKGMLEEKEEELGSQSKDLTVARRKADQPSISLGKVLSGFANDLLQSNVKGISEIPLVGPSLAGMITSQSSAVPDQPQLAAAEVSFKRDEDLNGSSLSERDQRLLAFGQEVQSQFNQEQFVQIVEILDLLSKDKSELKAVLDYLKDEPGQNEEDQI